MRLVLGVLFQHATIGWSSHSLLSTQLALTLALQFPELKRLSGTRSPAISPSICCSFANQTLPLLLLTLCSRVPFLPAYSSKSSTFIPTLNLATLTNLLAAVASAKHM